MPPFWLGAVASSYLSWVRINSKSSLSSSRQLADQLHKLALFFLFQHQKHHGNQIEISVFGNGSYNPSHRIQGFCQIQIDAQFVPCRQRKLGLEQHPIHAEILSLEVQ